MTVAATATATAAARPAAAMSAGAAELDYRPSYLAAAIAGLLLQVREEPLHQARGGVVVQRAWAARRRGQR
jgi:hypothetical protein